MDTRYSLQDILFEWDRTKATANLKKHKVHFETACEAFFDPFVYLLDEEQNGEEQREKFIGMTLEWNVLCVVYTERQGDVFRIISARPATSIERGYYEEQ
ncbi:MAG TPA: BrnT family toxin [Gammaproteobacteria bacterium]|nr:BrnT family toxin [Gammaproteobacteria bacterium]